MRLLGIVIVGAVLGLAQAASAAEYDDEWRYAAARGRASAQAELVRDGRPIFVVSCAAPGDLQVTFSTVGDEEPDPRKWAPAAYRDLDIVLYDPKTGRDERLVMKGELRRRSIVGRLALTPELAQRIAGSRDIAFYGENGPSNDFYGGEARALRRVVRECAAG